MVTRSTRDVLWPKSFEREEFRGVIFRVDLVDGDSGASVVEFRNKMAAGVNFKNFVA